MISTCKNPDANLYRVFLCLGYIRGFRARSDPRRRITGNLAPCGCVAAVVYKEYTPLLYSPQNATLPRTASADWSVLFFWGGGFTVSADWSILFFWGGRYANVAK